MHNQIIMRMLQYLVGFIRLVADYKKIRQLAYRAYWEHKVPCQIICETELAGIQITQNTYESFDLPILHYPWDGRDIELFWIKKIVEFYKPLRLLELGTFTGLTTLYMARYSLPNASVYTVDLPDCEFNKFKPEPNVTIGMRYQDMPESMKINEVRTNIDTITPATFGNKPFDLIFVDANLNYNSVSKHSTIAFNMLSESGIIMWRNYAYDRSVDYMRFLNELNEQKKLRRIYGTSIVYFRNGWKDT